MEDSCRELKELQNKDDYFNMHKKIKEATRESSLPVQIIQDK